MFMTIASKVYHYWININKNKHFKNELSHLKKNSCNKIIPLPKEYRDEIINYYSALGYKKIDLGWHQYIFSQTGKMDVRFIPENLYHIIIEPQYTRTRTEWEDKAYMEKFLPGVKFPDTIVRNVNGYFIDNQDKIITIDQAIDAMEQNDSMIIKPTIETGSGRGVELIFGNQNKDDILKKYNKNYIVQKQLKQSKKYAQFNESSVNTEKIISFLFKGEVYILTSMLRVGAEGSITDTASTGEGYTVGINEDGRLNEVGYSIFGKKLVTTSKGVAFSSIVLDQHLRIVETIKDAHKKLLYFGIISWDFAVDENEEIILIEYNLNYPDVLIYQMNNGALFGDMTDTVLKECKRMFPSTI